jgi:superfamily II DNA or RNA helicase
MILDSWRCAIGTFRMIEIVVDNRIRLHGAPAELLPELNALFVHENKQRTALQRMGVAGWWAQPGSYETWRVEHGQHTYPRGGWQRIRTHLKSRGIAYSVRDARSNGTGPANSIPPELKRAPRPHQVHLVEAAREREQCIVLAPTGSGKSFALLALAARLQVPTLVVVPSVGLFTQWISAAMFEFGLGPGEIGTIRGKVKELRPITIAVAKSIHMLVKADDRKTIDYFGCVMFDEVHGAAAFTAFELVDAFPARYRFGTSADHRRKDKKEFLTRDLFGDVAYQVERQSLEASGVILEVEVRVVPTEFSADWYGVPSRDPDAPHKKIDFVRLAREMSKDFARNKLAIDIVREEVAAGARCIVLAHERDHVAALAAVLTAAGLRVGLMVGGEEREFSRTATGLGDGSVQVGIGTYKALGTGIDLPAVGAAICVTPILANQQFFGQVRGRVCRTDAGKTSARLYALVDERVHTTHITNARRWNAERVFVRQGSRWVAVGVYLDSGK